jgi:hypothetical protein
MAWLYGATGRGALGMLMICFFCVIMVVSSK